MSERPARFGRDAFRLFRSVPTRWMDNDVYGHVNNVTYYAFFDTAVNGHLIEAGCLEIATSPVVGLVVETACTFFEPIAFPETIETAIAVETIGRSSVRYRVGIFKAGGELAAAQGRFVHVWTERATGRPSTLSPALRGALEPLRV